ncbi:MAG: MoaD/ThiS family protein [Desulfurococcaceae archaeon TW002]
MVKLKLHGVFAHLVGINEVYVEVREPTPVNELLKKLIPRYEEFKTKIILVNDKPSGEETLVSGDDEIKVLPVLSGG